MCSRNGSKRLVGKIAVIKNLTEKMTFGTFMTIIRSKYNQFLSYFFVSDLFRDQIDGSETSSINQITKRMLDTIVVPLPPVEVQRQIAERIEAERALLESSKKLIEIYDQKTKDVIAKLWEE
jgi:type I restriction enzyme S subunit